MEKEDQESVTNSAGSQGDSQDDSQMFSQEEDGSEELGGDDLKAALKKARADAAKYRVRAKQTEERLATLEGQKTAEVKALTEALAEGKESLVALEAQIAQATMKSDVVNVAASMGFRNPADAWAFIDLAALEVGEDGAVKGVKEQLKVIAEQKPYLIGKVGAAAPFAATNPASPGAPQAQTSEEQMESELFGSRRSSIFDRSPGGVSLVDKKWTAGGEGGTGEVPAHVTVGGE